MLTTQKKSFLISGIVLLSILITVWLSLSAIVTAIVNKKIHKIGEYRGRVEYVLLSPLRGAYSLNGLRLLKVTGKVTAPFFYAKRIDFNVSWKGILKGVFVGDMEFFSPEINFVDAEKDEDKQTNLKGTGTDAKKATKEISPLRIDRILIHDGTIHFKRSDSEPPVDIYLRGIQAEAKNLTNSKDLSKSLMATVEAKGQAMNEGDFSLQVALNPFAPQPTFETRSQIDFSLPELNDFLKHYLAIEAKAGRMDIFIEAAAADGSFKGYVKPFMQGINFIELKNEDKSPKDVVKGSLAKLFSNLFKNRKKLDNAAKVKVEGTFKDPDIKIMDAILSFFGNAFFEGLQPGFEKKDEPHITPQGTVSENKAEPKVTEATPAQAE